MRHRWVEYRLMLSEPAAWMKHHECNGGSSSLRNVLSTGAITWPTFVNIPYAKGPRSRQAQTQTTLAQPWPSEARPQRVHYRPSPHSLITAFHRLTLFRTAWHLPGSPAVRVVPVVASSAKMDIIYPWLALTINWSIYICLTSLVIHVSHWHSHLFP